MQGDDLLAALFVRFAASSGSDSSLASLFDIRTLGSLGCTVMLGLRTENRRLWSECGFIHARTLGRSEGRDFQNDKKRQADQRDSLIGPASFIWISAAFSRPLAHSGLPEDMS